MAIINSNFRITGLASGLDTDQMVRDLMAVERIPLNKLQQQRQLAQWRQDAYREITNALRSFKEKFFDITKRTNYMLSDNAFRVFSAKSSSDAYVTVKGTTQAESGSHTVKVRQLATADKAESLKGVSIAITGSVSRYNLSGESILVTLDGVTREINLANYEDLADLIGDEGNGLQKLLDDAFGQGKILVSENDGKLQMTTANGATRVSVSYGTKGTKGLEALGFTAGATNRISTGTTLLGLKDQLATPLNFDATGKVSFEINGETFAFSENDTLTKVMETINNSKAGVTIRYDEATDKFIITAKQTGAGDNIRISEKTGNFIQAIGIDAANPVTEQGVDAIAEIDGVTVTRSTNTFTVNGIEYTLRKQHEATQVGETITVEQDVDAVYDAIKTFVDEYNKLVDLLTTKLGEKYDRNYLPLTDEQKEALSEKDIERWEKQAKTGLLRNDSILQNIRSSMRMALIDAVEGVGISLSSIGITSKSYQDNGKLTIDEAKLKQAIREKPDEVKNLFKQQSVDVPSYSRDLTAEQRSIRSKQQGLLYRLSDILEDNISIFRDKNGRKGILLEKAGMEGDSSEYNSSIARDIGDYDERIAEMLVKLARKEENYYKQFTQLETYINRMNSQMSWLLSQIGGNAQR